MVEIQGPKLLLTLTIIFITGMLIFMVIFRALITLEEFQESQLQINQTENQSTIETLKVIPWYLGGLYAGSVGIIIYFMLKKGKDGKEPPEFKRYYKLK